jgi:hypothetical protein
MTPIAIDDSDCRKESRRAAKGNLLAGGFKHQANPFQTTPRCTPLVVSPRGEGYRVGS